MNNIINTQDSQAMPLNTNLVSITGLYLNDYDRIVKPQQQFLVPNYFIYYWVRELGAPLSWIIISLQQACWRADADTCIITQSTIAEEIGASDRTVIRTLQHPLRHWFIPIVTTQNRGNNHLPNAYTVYLSTPLTPHHLTSLDAYLAATAPTGTLNTLTAAIEALLAQRSKDALAKIETHYSNVAQFTHPIAVFALVQQRLTTTTATTDDQRTLATLCNRLQDHLTSIGYTMCRQYFRREWVSQLGPGPAWLVMAARSSCYFNPRTGDLRDTTTWSKKDLTAIIGQTSDSLRKGLITRNKAIHHFLQIIEEARHTLTFRVAMAKEPLIYQSFEENWDMQPQTHKTSRKIVTSDAGNLSHTEDLSRNIVTSETGFLSLRDTSNRNSVISDDPKPEICHPFKVLQDSILIESIPDQIPVVIEKKKEQPPDTVWQFVLDTLQGQMPKVVFEQWLKPTRLLGIEGYMFKVAVATPYAKDWLEHRLTKVVVRAITLITGIPAQVSFVLDEEK